MKLRSQLLLLSLFTLSLPWVGCQYIKEMDTALKDGQLRALTATANAVAATFESNATHISSLQAFLPKSKSISIYANDAENAIILDGYSSDWSQFKKQCLFPNTACSEADQNSPHSTLIAARNKKNLQLMLFVRRASVQYYNPLKNISTSEHIVLTALDVHQQYRHIYIAASAPGVAEVWLGSQTDKEQTLENAYQGKALWRENAAGYQLEIELPLSWAVSGLRVGIYPGDASAGVIYSNSQIKKDIPPLSFASEMITTQLEIFRRENIQLKIVTKNSFIVAHTRPPERQQVEKPSHWLLSWLYQSILSGSGRDKPVRVKAPITIQEQLYFFIIAEENDLSLRSFTHTAFNRLILYSIFISFSVAFVLLGYASWLSFRIRHLSESAKFAVSENGAITANFKASIVADEIGDMSQSFSTLLSRLREYTDYLKSLASKLSHELRTPLAIVSSSLDNLEYHQLEPEAKKYVLRAREGSERLANILNAMSSATRIEQAIKKSEQHKLELKSLVAELHATYSDLYPKHTILLTLEDKTEKNPNDIAIFVEGSQDLLVQMLDKLMDNAVDFCSEDGSITIGLCADKTHVSLYVCNDGPPLPGKMKNQLFDSFVSIRTSNTHSNTDPYHLGLGLHIVKLISDFHRGRVSADTLSDDNGAIFTLCIPRVLGDTEACTE